MAANQTWAVDCIHDSLMDGRRFRAFAVLDEWSRERLAIEVDLSLTGERVTRVLERLRIMRGLPTVIQADNVARRVQSRTSPFAHRLASSGPGDGRRGATRSGLGSKTRQFFGHSHERVKGGQKNLGL